MKANRSKLSAEHEALTVALPALANAREGLFSSYPPPAAAVEKFAVEVDRMRTTLVQHLDNEEASAVVALLKCTRDDISRMFGGRF